MKYRPDFPARFGCYEDGLSSSRKFFDWYNNEHYHSGIGLVTPGNRHANGTHPLIEIGA
jgi:putative transposase